MGSESPGIQIAGVVPSRGSQRANGRQDRGEGWREGWREHDRAIRDCVKRARAGDEPAFESIVLRLSPRVRRTARSVLNDRHEVEDIVQDTFFAVYRRLSGLRDPAAFDGWVLRIARNLALDHARRLKRCRPSMRVYQEAGDRAPDLPRVMRRTGSSEVPPEALGNFVEAFEQLAEPVRDALRMRYGEGLTCLEIGRREGLGVSCVKTRLHRGRRELRRALGVARA